MIFNIFNIFNIKKLQNKLHWFKLPNLMFYIVLLTGILYFADLIMNFTTKTSSLSSLLSFDKNLIFHGELFRIISYIFLTPKINIALAFLYFYFLNFIGNSVERHWSANQLTLYYFLGYLLTTCVGFLVGTTTIVFLNLSLIFVFIAIYPNASLNVFSFINLRIDWLGIGCALLFIVKLIISLATFNLGSVFAELIAILNFMIFFGPRYFINLFNNFKQFMKQQHL